MIANRYSIIKKLGSGGFGEVFLAKDTRLGIEVALKRYHLDKMASKLGGIERAKKYSVLNEIRKAIRYNHKNVARYFDAFSYEEVSTFGKEQYEIGVMEHLAGGNLHEYVMKHGAESKNVKKAFIEILEGLAYLHRKGVIHRDIKPGNIIFNEENTPKILDFGISKDMNTSKQESSIMLATTEYMAPEQIDKTKFGIENEIKSNVDFWMYGVMLFYLCTGEHPFGKVSTDEDAETVRANILKYDINSLDWAKVPQQYHSIIKACLVRNASERIHDANALITLFSEKSTDQPTPQPKPTNLEDKTKQPPKPENEEKTIIKEKNPPAKPIQPNKPDRPAISPEINYKIPLIAAAAIAAIIVLFVLQPWKNSSSIKTETEKFVNYTKTKGGINIDMIAIEGGTFTMGSPANEANHEIDETQHPVTLSSFYMSKTEVTFAQYDAFCEATGRKKPDDEGWGRGSRPVINVTWHDATAFAKWMGCRLPTEAEWEYACRAGTTTTPFNTGSNLTTAQANYDGNYPYNGNAKGMYRKKTLPVGSFAPNSWGLYDMHGNVWEWCSDWYDKYPEGSQTNPKGASSRNSRVDRGGGWFNDAQYCRSAYRSGSSPGYSNLSIGFRLVSPQFTP